MFGMMPSEKIVQTNYAAHFQKLPICYYVAHAIFFYKEPGGTMWTLQKPHFRNGHKMSFRPFCNTEMSFWPVACHKYLNVNVEYLAACG